MIQEVAAISPQEYERQQKDDLASSGGVRNVAKFVESLADRQTSFASSPHAALDNELMDVDTKRKSISDNVQGLTCDAFRLCIPARDSTLTVALTIRLQGMTCFVLGLLGSWISRGYHAGAQSWWPARSLC